MTSGVVVYTSLLAVSLGSATMGSLRDSVLQGESAKVSGVLMQSEEGRKVVLARVRLMNLRGEEIRTLAPQGAAIVDVVERVSVTRTDASGRFGFAAVPAGRYAIGLAAKGTDAMTSQLSFAEYRRPRAVVQFGQSTEEVRPVFFDLASGETLDLKEIWEPRPKK